MTLLYPRYLHYIQLHNQSGPAQRAVVASELQPRRMSLMDLPWTLNYECQLHQHESTLNPFMSFFGVNWLPFGN